MTETEKSEEDKEFSKLMYEHSKVLENYGQKADKLLRSIQKNFENDYTSFCVGFGSIAVIASVGLIAFGKSETFAMMLLATGFAAVISGVCLRRLSTKEKLEGLPKILEFEKEQARIQQKERIYSRLWLDGKPKGLSDEQFNLLLSDNSIPPRSSDDA
jgi:archaellum biogenesis protein FlaJ (TadC family)